MNFYIPEFYVGNQITLTLLDMIRQHSEMFVDGLDIGAVYGTFGRMLWNGGRAICSMEELGDDIIVSLANEYDKLGVPLRFTLTNLCVEEKHLSDKYCNHVLGLLEGKNYEILVANDLLESYLRSHYPGYRYVSSITKCLTDKKKVIEELNKDYYMVVLDYRLNKDLEFLYDLPRKEKVELLVNEVCPIGCKHRMEHYVVNSQIQLLEPCQIDASDGYLCKNPVYTSDYTPYDVLKNPMSILREEVPVYEDLGIHNFKIGGRTHSWVDVIEFYVYYFVKPEYQNRVRNLLLKKMGM